VIDRVEITVRGGNGGNGIVSFRREKYIPRGGPNGGDGGDGGAVILKASRSVRTLQELGRRRSYAAERGQHGQGSDKHGRNGEDLVLEIPPGTQVTMILPDGGEQLLGDLVEAGQALVVARGGIGGWGNARFATSVRRAPRIAQRGQKGEDARLRLDLKLLADVGIVGMPNAGKSTLLNQISAARAKIGDYPFTTLEPALGVVDVGWDRFVVADIPGLIEGAHAGAGLGLDFLRHIERTRVIIHLLDGSGDDPWRDMDTVNKEMREYRRGLESRPQIVAINKIDMPEVEERVPTLLEEAKARCLTVRFISAAVGTGVADLLEDVARALREAQEAVQSAEEPLTAPHVLHPAGNGVRVSRENAAYRVEGERAVAFAEMMPLEAEEGRAELWRRFQRWGVTGALKRAGARRGDRVLLGRAEIEMEE
jgi:GTP-binding protein